MNAAEVSWIRQETPTVKSFRLTLLEGACSFRSGQWVNVYFEAAPADPDVLVGGFSITSSPLHEDYIEIAVKKIPEGRASVRMHECVEVGDVVMVDGGYGDFYYCAGMAQNVVLIGGGIGITPLMSMMRFIDEAELDVAVTLCYSARTPSELLFRAELEAMARRRETLCCHFTVTRPGLETWTGPTGRLDERLLSGLCNEQALFYLCGPRGFVQDIGRMLRASGVASSRLKYETW